MAETTYLQLGIRGIDESISQNRVPVLNVGTTGEKKKDNKDLMRSQLFHPKSMDLNFVGLALSF